LFFKKAGYRKGGLLTQRTTTRKKQTKKKTKEEEKGQKCKKVVEDTLNSNQQHQIEGVAGCRVRSGVGGPVLARSL
jgi:hypothetical protein